MSHVDSPAAEVAEFDLPNARSQLRHPCPRLAEYAWLASDRVIDLENGLHFITRRFTERVADGIGEASMREYQSALGRFASDIACARTDLEVACIELRCQAAWDTAAEIMRRTNEATTERRVPA